MRNHIVIIGWKAIGRKLIDELNSQKIYDIKVIGGLPENKLKFLKEKYLRHYHLKRAPEADLKKVYCEKAKAIIILSDENWALSEGKKDVDFWTIGILNDIKKYLKQNVGKKKPWPRIIAEMQNEQNEELAYDHGANEVISVRTFGYELLAHSATRPGLSAVYTELLKTAGDNNEIYFEPINDEVFQNERQLEYSSLIEKLKLSSKLLGKTAIGIVKNGAREDNLESTKKNNGDMCINPESHFKVMPKDELIVIKRDSGKNESTASKKRRV